MPRTKENLKDLGNSLHRRLLEGGDPTAGSETVEAFLPRLASALKNRFPGISDPHLITTVATDSVLSFLHHPEVFDQSRSSLIGYLYMDAYRNLQNILTDRQKSVELYHPDPEYSVNALESPDQPDQQLLEESSPILLAVYSLVEDPRDRELVTLMMERVRETEEYSRVLGILDRPAEEQAAVVKRHKDRLKAQLKRKLSRYRSKH
jgi:hypothetical protein